MAWELDPDFALHSRLSFGRSTRRWLVLSTMGAIVAGFVVPDVRLPVLLKITGLTLLAIAPPYGALNLIALERSHRLDLRRLAGRSTLGWVLASVFGTSWLLVALGVSLLLGARHVGFDVGGGVGVAVGVIEPLTVLSIGMTVALILLITPGLHDADGRMLFALVLMVAVGTMVAGWRARADPALALIGAGGCAALLPAALRQMRRHRSVRRRAVRNPLRGMVHLSRSRRPEFSRSVLSAGSSMIAALFLGVPNTIGVVLRVWIDWPRPDPARWAVPLGFVAYVALTIAALGCSTQSRVEHASGGLDRIRLTSQHAWAVVIEMAAGAALPLVLLSTWFIGLVCLSSPSSAAVRAWPAVVVVALFGGLAEGLHGRKLGTYILPLAAICAMWHFTGPPWWPLFVVSLLLPTSAAASIAGPERRPVASRA